MIIEIATGRYPVTEQYIKDAYPNTSFPMSLDGVNLTVFGFATVFNTPFPEYNQMTQVVEEGAPAFNNGAYSQTWVIRDKTAKELAADQARLIMAYTFALDDHIEATANADNWDSRITCVMRAGYPNPWQAKGIAFGTWMDTCYALAYQIMADVQAQKRTLPSIKEFIDSMPKMEWPE